MILLRSLLLLSIYSVIAGFCYAEDVFLPFSPVDLRIDRLAVDRSWQKLDPDQSYVRIPPVHWSMGFRRLDFAFGPSGESDSVSWRLRYMLEGIDTKWHESGGIMRLSVRFFSSNGDVVGFKDFEARATSSGWRGKVSNSLFSDRQEKVIVPEKAVALGLFLVSGGHAFVVGAMAVDDLKLKIAGQSEALFEDDFETGVRLDESGGVPRGWQRAGVRRDIMQVVRFDGPATNHALAVLDANVQSFGEWTTRIPLQDRVKAGDILELRWRELFSVGAGSKQGALYARVPPGRYIFRVRAESPLEGIVLGETFLSAEVVEPFWQSLWFIILCFLMVGGGLVLSVRLVMYRRWQRRIERLEWQEALERYRSRIARDIHDDVGAGLTRIGLLCELISREVPLGSKVALVAEEIRQTARTMTQNMSEIVCAINPHYDTVEGLAGFAGRFAQNFLEVAGIRCRLDMPIDLSGLEMSAEVRHNLFLAFKESLHNVAKHAAASAVEVSLVVDEKQLILSVKDNGCGFAADRVPCGNGLNNMTTRMSALGGTCKIISKPGGGTIVNLILPVDRFSAGGQNGRLYKG